MRTILMWYLQWRKAKALDEFHESKYKHVQEVQDKLWRKVTYYDTLINKLPISKSENNDFSNSIINIIIIVVIAVSAFALLGVLIG